MSTEHRELTESELDMVAGGAADLLTKTGMWLTEYTYGVQYASHMTQRQTSSDQSIIGNIRP